MKIEIQASSAAASIQLDPPSAVVDQNNSTELQVSFSSNSTGIINQLCKIVETKINLEQKLLNQTALKCKLYSKQCCHFPSLSEIYLHRVMYRLC